MDEKILKQQILSHGNLPTHVAIIMDGNGRWARQKQQPRVEGHREGIIQFVKSFGYAASLK